MRLDAVKFITDLRVEGQKPLTPNEKQKIEDDPKKEKIIEKEVRERLNAIKQIYPLEKREGALVDLIQNLDILEELPHETGKASRVSVVRDLAAALLKGTRDEMPDKSKM